ncbi:hypothetical protein GQ42DRAFT_160462 [Ramicandelaber brevisporus]|nr:hypothetical protein GQ42DRAFT_160462 [Ramicandelaber brevisporus]
MKTDPLKVAEGAHAALKPSGAFIGEFGGHLNVAEVHSACINTINKFLAREPVNGADGQPVDGVKLSPWYFPDIDEYRSVLEKAGFEVKHISLTPRITPLPSDVAGWLKTFAGPFMQVLSSDEEKDQFVNEVQEMLRPVCCRNGKWSIMYNRMRFVAIKV